MERAGSIFLILCAAALSGCLPAFDVNVATPEPIKVDMTMDVNVYQHGKTDKEAAEVQATYRAAMTARRNRMEEIQNLKNQRLVGENHNGELTIRNRPAGEYGEYVSKTVADENRDRLFLMKHEAAEKGVPLSEIRAEQWSHWQRKSFPGEWIEVLDDDGVGHQWKQKESAAGSQ